MRQRFYLWKFLTISGIFEQCNLSALKKNPGKTTFKEKCFEAFRFPDKKLEVKKVFIIRC